MSKTTTRVRDPRYVPVQLNVHVPWAFREFLINEAAERKVSLASLVSGALMSEFGETYEAEEAVLAKEATSGAGATR